MKNRLIFLSLIYVLPIIHSKAQMANLFTKLPKAKWSKETLTPHLSDEEKIERLSLLPAGDSVQFEFPDYDPEEYPDDPRYFPLDTARLYYLDLDFDGDLDLLYSGASGWMTLADTKVYLNEKGEYKFLKILNGRILDINQKADHFHVFTIWFPCCDSYTTRIEKYSFFNNQMAHFDYSISVIGLERLNGMREFNSLESAKVMDAQLMVSKQDFRGMHPYFRDQNKVMLDSLRSGHHVTLATLSGEVGVKIIGQKEVNGQQWHLVLTDAVKNAPPSHYEWSAGPNRRFVGWVKDIKID